MNKKRKTIGVVYIKGIDSNLKHQFVAKCIRHKLTIQTAVENLILYWLEDPTKLYMPNKSAWKEPFGRKTTLYCRCIDYDIYCQFRSQCYLRKITRKIAITVLIRAFLDCQWALGSNKVRTPKPARKKEQELQQKELERLQNG